MTHAEKHTKRLRGYQQEGIDAMLAMKGDVLLADEPGLGKTPQAIGYLNVKRPESVLVVCPASLRENWRRELGEWLAYAPEKLDITSYEQIARHLDTEYGVAVFDEAHYLKNPKAQRTKNAFLVNARRRLYLTGTPIVNRPLDLYPILSHIAPELWGTLTAFGRRYCAGKLVPIKFLRGRPVKYAWDFTGASNLKELAHRLRSTCMVRRRKRDVLTELPPKIRTVLEIDAPAHEPASLVEAANRMFEMNAYRGLTGFDRQLEEARRIAFEELSRARLETALRKLPHLVPLIGDLLEEEEKVVVFAYHREVIDKLESELSKFSPVKLYGGMGDRQKDLAVGKFQSGDARVFLGQITAAGTGLTLTAAHTLLFAELDWVPGNVIQCEDRCHRFGQSEPVRIFHLAFRDSIDGRMVKALVAKQKTIEQIAR